MTQDERFLKSQLAALISFDLEDVGDVFEPLLDFESEGDLLEYMCALLGDDTNGEVKTFVSNIMRFQKGLSLIPSNLESRTRDVAGAGTDTDTGMNSGVNSSAVNSPTAAASERVPDNQTSQKQQETMRLEQEKKEQRKREEMERKQNLLQEEEKRKRLEQQRLEQEQALLQFDKKRQEEQMQLDLAKSVAKLSVTDKAVRANPGKEAKKPVLVLAEPVKPEPEPKPTRPAKGKAKTVCGCYGTVHKPLTNCLHCGRISCKKEGYDYCPFCSNLIEKVNAVTSTNAGKTNFDKAILHKERLLKFDKESTQRTVIYDDQADYFQNSTSAWLTEDEQQDAQVQEEKRRKDLHTIKKFSLNIQF